MVNFRLPRVYPLTDARLSGLPHADQVAQFILGGATLVQLREKHYPPERLYRHAHAAVAAAEKAGAQLIINDRADIALAVAAHGVHLGQDDLPPEAARRLLGPQAVIGFSTHNLEQARKAIEQPVDYIAIGPIFETATKSDTFPVLGLDGLKAVRKAIGDFPLVAIGGISHTNAGDVIDAGADCVALISALLADPGGIATATRALVQSLPPLWST